MGRARIIGALVLAMLALAGAAGCDALPMGRAFNGDLVIVALGVDTEGTSIPASVVTLSVESTMVAESIDPRTDVTVPGTSYRQLREAYPFAGGVGVAEALASVQGGEPLPYIVLRSDQVVDLLGDEGVELELGDSVAAYTDGALHRLPAGVHTYAGAELSALLASVDYVSASDGRVVRNAIAEAVARAIAVRPQVLAALVDEDRTTSDLSRGGVDACTAAIKGTGGRVAFTPFR